MIECTTHRYWKDSAPVSDHVNLPVRPDQVLGSGTAGEQKDNPASRMFDGQVESEWRYGQSADGGADGALCAY